MDVGMYAVLSVLGLFVAVLIHVWMFRTRNELAGKAIFITGCDSGYGFSLAMHCLEKGMVVIAGCHKDVGEGRSLLVEKGIKVVSLELCSKESIKNAASFVNEICGSEGLYCLVNNAATLIFGESTWNTEEQIISQLKVNVVGPALMSRYCLPMLARGRGRILNLISNCAECPLPAVSVYTASKAALLAMSQASRPEMEKYGVKMVIVDPGDAPFKTPLCSNQGRHFETMDDELTEEELEIYGEYFHRCRDKFTTTFPVPTFAPVDDANFYETMEAAIADQAPQAVYYNRPIITRLVFGIINSLPYEMYDKARLAIMQLPKFN